MKGFKQTMRGILKEDKAAAKPKRHPRPPPPPCEENARKGKYVPDKDGLTRVAKCQISKACAPASRFKRMHKHKTMIGGKSVTLAHDGKGKFYSQCDVAQPQEMRIPKVVFVHKRSSTPITRSLLSCDHGRCTALGKSICRR